MLDGIRNILGQSLHKTQLDAVGRKLPKLQFNYHELNIVLRKQLVNRFLDIIRDIAIHLPLCEFFFIGSHF